MAHNVSLSSHHITHGLADIHPALVNNPQILNLPLHGVLPFKNAGDPLDRQALQEAEETVGNLTIAHRLLPDLITSDMVQTSQIRLHTMRNAPSPQLVPDLANLLALIQNNHNIVMGHPDQVDHCLDQIDHRLDQIDDRLAQQGACIRNAQIINKNWSQLTAPFTPLVKHLSGDGHALAEPLRPLTITQATLQAYQPNGVVGTNPPDFNPHIGDYTILDILKFIIFYNDDFGITTDDAPHD